MTGFLLRVAIVALGLWLATYLLPGLYFDGPGTLLAAALLLGIVNAVIRPIAVVLTLPLTLLSLGLFLLVINAAMLGLVALLLSLPALLVSLGLFLLVINAAMLGLVALMLSGFHIAGFWTAIAGALIVSIVSWIGSWFIGPKGRVEIIRVKRD